ncbi:MAG: efflux RND transporter periplasmic adaptor subunit [Sphaerochaeta sp.]|jgi:multidrug resistance efflux pump|nr:efflux RND transporter periplasmic adaptor subunit [Sphaerochaeta sp.]MDX9914282.1 efflux RND transporter periplasmic adaptor subunit [Sphaerochaeta sp.]
MSENKSENQVRNQLRKKQRRQRIKRLITTVVIIALIGGGLFLYNFYKENERFPWAEKRAPISAVREVEAQVTESIFTTTIDLSGYVEPNEIQKVLLRATGTVTDVFVKEGEQIKKGDVLIAIDNTDQLYNVASLEADLERILLTGSERDRTLTEMKLESARKKLDYTKAYANFDGVVASVNVNVGDYFDAGSPAMTIIDRSTLKATVEIDEIDMQYVQLGQKAVLYFDSYPDSSIDAVVEYIPMIGRYTNQGIGVMDVELKIPSPPSTIAPGYTFDGSITSEGETKILLLPQSAVTTSRGSSSVTKKLEDGTTARVPVTVKYLGEGMSQLLSGDIKAGDTLVIRRTDTSNPFAAIGVSGPQMRMF